MVHGSFSSLKRKKSKVLAPDVNGESVPDTYPATPKENNLNKVNTSPTVDLMTGLCDDAYDWSHNAILDVDLENAL